MQVKSLRILGTRGVPAAHGGFETFAERLAPYLVERGWRVTVYCQDDGTGPVFEDEWRGVRRIRMPIATGGAAGTIVFDWKSTLHAAGEKGLVLTLGYNTAVFCALYRLRGLRNVINMDGLEWRRQKWGWLAKTWFWLNDWAGCWLGNHLVADHPEIKRHLSTRVSDKKITMIPYGSDRIESAAVESIGIYGLEHDRYAVIIARAEPENSILEIIKTWSNRRRGCKLAVLGKYEASHAYQRAVIEAASEEVLFLNAIYDKQLVQAIRFHSRFYVHGHQVGGTNPSLVEALGAGNAVLAHDNRFNRWVAGEAGVYFSNATEIEDNIRLLLDDDVLLNKLRTKSRNRHAALFTWERVLSDYEELLERSILC